MADLSQTLDEDEGNITICYLRSPKRSHDRDLHMLWLEDAKGIASSTQFMTLAGRSRGA